MLILFIYIVPRSLITCTLRAWFLNDFKTSVATLLLINHLIKTFLNHMVTRPSLFKLLYYEMEDEHKTKSMVRSIANIIIIYVYKMSFYKRWMQNEFFENIPHGGSFSYWVENSIIMSQS